MKKRVTRTLTWLGVVLLAVAVLFIIISVTTSRSLNKACRALEADGRPMRLEQILPAAIPDADNAALAYGAALRQLEFEELGGQDLFSRLADAASEVHSKPADAAALEAFRRLYEEGAVAKALAAVGEGSLKPGYRQDLDFSRGFAMELDHIDGLMKLSRILSATARLQASDGDHAGAWQTALTALRVANALEEEPLLVSQLVRAASLSLAVDAIQNLDLTSGAAGPRREEVDALLQRFEDPAPMVAAIDTERVIASETVFNRPADTRDVMEAGSGGDLGLGFMLGLYSLVPPLRHSDQAAHMSIMGEMARNIGQPFSPGDAGLGQRLIDDVASYCFVTRMTVPAIGSIKARMVSMFAEARVTRAGLAVLEHRNETGSYPADLQSLNLENAADPFTGQPLVYRPEPTGFTLYSLGRDLIDDHGAMLDDDRKGDIVWRYAETGGALPGN